MISWNNLHSILANVIPLYVVMIIAYSSVKWWKIFSPNECLGINRFVMLFAAPLFSIKYISNNNPYAMNYQFIAADTLQKGIVVVILSLWCKFSSRGSLEWFITLFSLSTLTNNLVIGIPLLGGMFGETPSQSLMVQIAVLQALIWYPSLLFLCEYRRATLLVPWKCPESSTNHNSSNNNNNDGENNNDLGFDEERNIGVDNGFVPPCHSTNNEIDDHEQDQGHDQRRNNGSNNGSNSSGHGSRSSVEAQPETGTSQNEPKLKDVFPSGVTTRLIFFMVWMKLIKNPNFYASIVALTWSLISFRLHIEMPIIVANTIKIMSDAGLGMAMFSLGLYMASQPKIIAGGIASASLAGVMRFVVGPAIMVATAFAVGLKGIVLQITILQAALPQAIVPFIFAREYNVHPAILSTSVGFGMLISLPITLAYYILLGFVIKQEG